MTFYSRHKTLAFSPGGCICKAMPLWYQIKRTYILCLEIDNHYNNLRHKSAYFLLTSKTILLIKIGGEDASVCGEFSVSCRRNTAKNTGPFNEESFGNISC